MQNANCLDLVLGHCLVYQLVSSYVSQQIRLTHLRAARELVSYSSSSTHHPNSHPHSKSLTKSQTDSPTDSPNDSLTDSSTDSPLIEPARSPRLAARLVRSLLESYLSICWFGHQLFASRTADSAAGRLCSIGHFHSTGHLHLIGRLYSINSDPFDPLSKLSNPTRSSSSFPSKSSLRSSSISLSSDHKPSALSPPHSAPRQLATSFSATFSATFSEPNRFNFLLNFTAAFVHMLDVALKLFILTGASTFMGKIIGRRTLNLPLTVKFRVEL